MQLVAFGAQDVYLSGSPQITFWKLVYRRHTNFATEDIEQTFNGQAGFGKKASVTVSRNGDLVTHMFLEVTAPMVSQLYNSNGTDTWTLSNASFARYVNSFGHALIESCECEIGGQRIDRVYSDYFEVCDELMRPEEKRIGYGKMIGKRYDSEGMPIDAAAGSNGLDDNSGIHTRPTFYIPLIFWFNNPANPGLALPLIALQYHEVKLQFSFRKFEDLIVKNENGTVSTATPYTAGNLAYMEGPTGTPSATPFSIGADEAVTLYCSYVYLDTDERRRFAQVSHEYLITQLQFTGVESVQLSKDNTKSEKIRLNFNHPVKELIWFCNSESSREKNHYFDYGEGVTEGGVKGYDYIKDAKLLLNGHDRFSTRQGSYFRMVQPFQCHTRIPSRHIYVYSFALRPEEYQPSGSCNMSRIDHAALHLTFNKPPGGADDTLRLTVYAINFNLLRLMSGMGGLAYSN
jgi:hypothetical protein